MKVLREGHRYELANFEKKDEAGQILQFIEKEPVIKRTEEGDPIITGELITVFDGTTNEEVIEVLIDRLNALYKKFPSRETAIAITHLETALLWLEKRTRDRIKRGVEGKHIK
jgi:hypothetical protein